MMDRERLKRLMLILGSSGGGSAGRLWILLFHGQSNAVGATGDGDATGALTTEPPDASRILMFNGGITPLQATPSSVSKTLAIDPAQYASVVAAREGANPFVNRETWSLSAARAFAGVMRPQDRVLLINCALGSCSFNDLVQGFTGSRATFSGSISGTSMTVTAVTVTAGVGLTNSLILNHASITPGTVITGVPTPEGEEGGPGGPGVYTVSPSQTVGSFTDATTSDPAPQPWTNLETLVTAAVAYAAREQMTPIIPAFLYNQGEVEQAGIVSQRTAQLATLRTKVDALKTITGQTQDILIVHPAVGAPIFNINHVPPANVGDDTPDDSLMQQVSPATLAADAAARSIANFTTFAQYFQSAGSTETAANRVHYDREGHKQMGMASGFIAADYIAGRPVSHPYMVSCTGLLGSTTRVVTLSEDAVIDESVVSDPGQRGVTYFDDTGALTVTDVAVSGTTLTLTFAAPPSGITERVEIACSNGTVLGTYTGASWPFTSPPVCLGPNFGQRSQIRALRHGGYHLDTNEPLPRFFLHQKQDVRITSDGRTLPEVFADLGVTPTFIIDASDPASYPDNGQTITDVSPAFTAWQLGIDGSATATDPTWTAPTSSEPAHFLFSTAGRSITPTSALTFADTWHRSTASFVVFAAFFLPSGPSYANAQTLFSTCTDATSGIGVQIRVSPSGRWGVVMQNGSGITLNANATGVLSAGWNVCAVGVDAANNRAWYMTPGPMASTGPENVTISLSSPSASAANGVVRPVLGKTAITADGSAKHLIAGSRVQMIAACAYQSAEKMRPLYNYLFTRVYGWSLPEAPTQNELAAPAYISPSLTFARAQAGGALSSYLDTDGTTILTAAADTPRFNGAAQRLLIEGQRTNLLLNSATLSTQSVTVTAAAHTLSFRGTGSVTRSGVSTGTTNGTGATDRVSVTFTPTAGSLTLTVAGSVTDAQLEVNPFATSYIPTTGAAATRGADLVTVPLSTLGIAANGAATYLFSVMIGQAAPSTANQVILCIDDGSANNQYLLRNSAGGATLTLIRSTGGVLVSTNYSAALVPGTPFKAGMTVSAAGRVALSIDGAAVAAVTGGPTSGLVTARLGNNSVGAPMFGEASYFRVIPYTVTDSDLQSLVSALP